MNKYKYKKSAKSSQLYTVITIKQVKPRIKYSFNYLIHDDSGCNYSMWCCNPCAYIPLYGVLHLCLR